MLNTPTLLITFNRPDHTRKVWNEIKKQRPKYMYVFQDGAREGNETDQEKCAAVRAIFEAPLDWECEMKTNFSVINLGCGRGPAAAISWFFENVEQGIILEDDCLPHPDFYIYCEQLLDKYKSDNRISLIGGSSFQNGNQRGDGSYYFGSGSYGTWGWASWRRAWSNFDYFVDGISQKQMKKLIHKYFLKQKQFSFWEEIFENVKKDRYKESCWDYQFYFSCWKKDMLAIIPNSNLVTNIGYDDQATHTSVDNHPAANLEVTSILPLNHPSSVSLNKVADLYVFKNFVVSYEYGWTGFKRLPYRINKRIKRLLNHSGPWFK